MKYIVPVVFITLIGIFMPAESPCYAEEKSRSSTPEEHNKSIVLRYIQEVLDGKQFYMMPELFAADIVMHRPEGELSILSYIQIIFAMGISPHTFRTTIHDIFASGDRVLVRLSHRVTYSSEQAFLRSRIGMFDVTGKTMHWDAMAIF